MKPSALIANSLWFASALPAWSRFRRALERPAETQMQWLRNALARNATTAFGKAHGFSGISSHADFARTVPLCDYDDLKPWIARILRGENGVLTAERVTHLVPTSGSSGARKLIPFTARLQREFSEAISAWIVDLYGRHPRLATGAAYWSISPAIQPADAEESAVRIGFDDDTAYLGGVKAWLLRAIAAVPSELRLVEDMERFRYMTLLNLLRRADLRLVSVWHPSFFTLLLDALPRFWDELLRDIASGPMAGRARQLLRANPLEPETIWLGLEVISCWSDAHATLAKADLARRFPTACIQSKGLLATEGFVTLPFAGAHPLAVCSHFFEFIDERGEIHGAHELEAGGIYEVVITTGGGLWRYRLGDQVEVTHFIGNTPSLRFLGRAGNVSDRFGEKISEAFAAQVIQTVTAQFPSPPRFALLAPDGACYTLYIEGAGDTGIAERLDGLLGENPHYAWCRRLGQLQSPRVFEIASGGFEAYAARLLQQGKRLGEIKPCPLSGESGWSDVFQGAYGVASPSKQDAKIF